MPVTVTTIGTDEAELELVWFRMPYIKKPARAGQYLCILREGGAQRQPSCDGAGSHLFRGSVRRHGAGIFAGVRSDWRNLEQSGHEDRALGARQRRTFKEYLPREIRSRYKLCEYNYAIKEIHFPENMDTLIAARNRLVFDEFFSLF